MSDDLNARLEAARKRKADAEARAAAAEAERASLAAVEAAEREASDAEARVAAAEKHGDKITCIDTDMGVVIVKRPNGAAYHKWQDAAKFDTVALKKLVYPCLVYPHADVFDRILDALPATLTRVANAVVELAGARSAELAGKAIG